MYFVNLVSTCISIMMGRGQPSSQYESVVRVCSVFVFCLPVCLFKHFLSGGKGIKKLKGPV